MYGNWTWANYLKPRSPEYSHVGLEDVLFAENDDPLIAGETWDEHEVKSHRKVYSETELAHIRHVVRGNTASAPWVYARDAENFIEIKLRRKLEKQWSMGFDGKLPPTLLKTGSWSVFWEEYKQSDEYIFEFEDYERFMGYN